MQSPFLNPDMKAALEKTAVVKQFPKGTVIVRENSFIKTIPIVSKGILKVARQDEDGQELVLYYIKPGESCVMSFLGGLHHDTSKIHAEAVEDTELILIPVENSTQWLKDFPEWTAYFFELYHKRFEELLNMVKVMAFENMEARILHLLMQKSQLTSSKVIYTTHDQLAHELASTRVVISRLLKQLENNKQVLLGRGYVKLI
jgi:CRP/FNR family transcriptional regulator, anaerobic regulatory protein